MDRPSGTPEKGQNLVFHRPYLHLSDKSRHANLTEHRKKPPGGVDVTPHVGAGARPLVAALEAVESVAPAVLWIDEIEMGIAGYSEGQTGSATRIFSTFLTWMQEHQASVFVAATANRINLLPAEILRKGRFDQVFFVDLPNEEERKEILKIHFVRNQLDSAQFDLMLLASATRNWNGAEIEQAVISARIAAHAKGIELNQNDMLASMGKIIPLSRTMEEQCKSIRSWARNRALPATKPSKPVL